MKNEHFLEKAFTVTKNYFALLALAVCITGGSLLGNVASASPLLSEDTSKHAALSLLTDAQKNSTASFGRLPKNNLKGGPDRVMHVAMTAYNSLPNQTDDTPFITAMGSTTRRGIVAANFVPLGTYIKIPELFGDEVFIVEDRMNARYTQRVDIWMEHYQEARQFGVKKSVAIEIYYEK